MEIIKRLNFKDAAEYLIPSLGKGLGLVIQVTLLAFLLGIILGLFIAIGRISKHKVLKTFLVIFIEFIRGTPLLVQIVYMYFVMPLLVEILLQLIGTDFKFDISPLVAGVLALGINYSCYLSEVIRGAIESIDSGQMEAGLALGFGKTETLFRIVLPQAIRNVIPVFGNYLIMMVKDTSLLAYISVFELLLRTQTYASQTFLTIESYTILAAAYLIISLPMSQAVKLVERKLSKL